MNDPALQKLPPQSIESEDALLSACLLGYAEDSVELVNSYDFYRKANQKIFESICDLVDEKEPVDLVTVTNKLRGKNELEEVGGAAYLARLVDSIPSPNSLESYAEIIKKCAKKRNIIKICVETIGKCYENMDVSQILGDHDLKISNIKMHSGSFVKIGDIIEPVIERLDEIVKNPGPSGIPTGLYDIDKKFGGLPGSSLIVFGGRPGMGKTAFGMRIARGAAQCRIPVLEISLEMSKEQLLIREISSDSGIDGERFNTGELDSTHWARIIDSASKIDKLPIWIDDSPTATIKELQSKIRKFHKQQGRCLILIDYLDYVKGVESERKDLEIGTITKGLKASAKEHDIPIVLFVQLNRKCEERTDKRPIVSDLRNSGEIEQDADIIIFIYRDEVYNEDPHNPHKGIAEIIIRKHRNGKTGTIKLAWIAHRTTFECIAR